MGKWLLRLFLVGVLGWVGFTAYDLHRGGYFNLPEDMPRDAYPISFKSGLRGIVSGVEVSRFSNPNGSPMFRRLAWASPDRQFLGVPMQVAPWFEDAWSICTPPTEEERATIDRTMPDDMKRDLANARLDAVCRIEVDGEELLRGLIYSVPKL